MSANRYAGICCRCEKPVAAGEGYMMGKAAGEWQVTHKSCVPVIPPKPRKLEYDL